MDDTNAKQAARARYRSLGQLVRRLVVSIRDGDEHKIEDAVLQLSKKRRIFAPLALAVSALAMLFSGLRLLVTNWRLMLVQVLPAMLIWATGRDKLAATAVSGILGAIVCAPPYAIVRIGLVLLGSNALFWLGVAILVVGLILQAGVTGAVKAVKVSAKLLVGQPLDTSDGQSASVPDG